MRRGGRAGVALVLGAVAVGALPLAAQRPVEALPDLASIAQTGEFTSTLAPEAGIRRLSVRPGEVWDVSLSSDEFDTLLRLVAGSDTLVNDDWGSTTDSRIRITVPDGVSTLWVIPDRYTTTGLGRYDLSLRRVGVGRREETPGVIGPDASVSPKGERFVSHPVELEAGVPVELSLEDPDGELALVAVSPEGEHVGGTLLANGLWGVTMESPTPGRWTAHVVAPAWIDHEVAYTLRVTALLGAESGRRERGRLLGGDSLAVRGELFDRYTHDHEGGPLNVRLTSEDFDTYLVVVLPDGSRHFNDDAPNGGSELMISEVPAGEVLVYVTSFRPGEMGRYELLVSGG